MALRVARTLIACALIVTGSAATAVADDCKLSRVASFDFVDNNGIAIPVSIGGVPKQMIIDTNASISTIDAKTANDLHLVAYRMLQGTWFDRMGLQFTYMAEVRNLVIGQFRAEKANFMISHSPLSDDGSIAGAIGFDLMGHYDVDIDFGNHKLNFFSQDHCPGKVVYWQNDGVAVIPMKLMGVGDIVIPVKLDDREIDAELDTGSTRTVLSTEWAKNLFGLTPGSPDVFSAGSVTGIITTPAYRHTFKTLSFQGLTFDNPTVYMWENLPRLGMDQVVLTGTRVNEPDEMDGLTDLSLGLNELRHLHLYIAYKEKKLYVTPASASMAVASGAAPVAPASSKQSATAASR